MVDNRQLLWELLGVGLIVGGPVAGSVILSNKSPETWAVIHGAATKLFRTLSHFAL